MDPGAVPGSSTIFSICAERSASRSRGFGTFQAPLGDWRRRLPTVLSDAKTEKSGAETGSTRVVKASCGVRLSAVTGKIVINANDNFVVANDNFAGEAGDAIAA